jgi:hypothetical protein
MRPSSDPVDPAIVRAKVEPGEHLGRANLLRDRRGKVLEVGDWVYHSVSCRFGCVMGPSYRDRWMPRVRVWDHDGRRIHEHEVTWDAQYLNKTEPSVEMESALMLELLSQ